MQASATSFRSEILSQNDPVYDTGLPLAKRYRDLPPCHVYPPFTFGELILKEAERLLVDKPVGSWLIGYHTAAYNEKTVTVYHLAEKRRVSCFDASLYTYAFLKAQNFSRKLWIVPSAFTCNVKSKVRRAVAILKRLFKGCLQGGCHLNKNYFSEIIDRQHRYAYQIEPVMRIWKNSVSLNSFNEWLSFLENKVPVDGYENLKLQDFIREDGSLVSFSRVTYYNHIEANKNELIISTSGELSTERLGPFKDLVYEVLIYVVDTNHKIFIDRYKPGILHHSSMVFGHSVVSAGQVVLSNGKITSLTNRSGHYKPTRQMFLDGLKVFEAKRIDLSHVSVFICSLTVFTMANSFLEHGLDLPPHLYWQLDIPGAFQEMSGEEACKRLENAEFGSWLIRFSSRRKMHIITGIVFSGDIIHESLVSLVDANRFWDETKRIMFF